MLSRWRLRRKLDSLALYNDKGVLWAKHTPLQAQAERQRRMDEIRALVQNIGRDQLPAKLIEALDSGALSSDATGCFADMLKKA